MNDASKTILVVEDSRSQMAFIRAFLARFGFKAVEALDGASAHEQAHAHPLDAIILDWELPDSTGPEILRTWQDDPVLKWVPVIMITTHTDSEMIERALDSGAVDFVRKPLDPVELNARLRSALRIKELQDRLRREASHDPLTGLLNRRALLARLEEELRRGLPNALSAAVQRITFSAGLASLSDDITTSEQLLKAADEALYAANHSGRNRVCAADACNT